MAIFNSTLLVYQKAFGSVQWAVPLFPPTKMTNVIGKMLINNDQKIKNWLVVEPPLRKICKLGCFLPIYGKISVFQTTKQ